MFAAEKEVLKKEPYIIYIYNCLGECQRTQLLVIYGWVPMGPEHIS